MNEDATGAGTAASPAEALIEPTRRVGARWVTGAIMVNLVINVAFFAPINILIGLQATAIDAGNKEAILTLVTACGAAVALVANPVTGALSDRTTSRWGRRSPWILAGAVLGTAAMLFLSGATTVAALVIGWALVQAGCNAMYSTITAAVPDRVPVAQRASVGGLAAMGQTLGILGGSVVGFVISGNIAVGYWICAAAIAVGVIPYLTHRDDPVLPPGHHPPFRLGRFLRSFWINPVKHPDFGWAWLTRFLMFVGNQLVIVYLLFFLTDVIHHPDPAAGVLVLTGLYAVMVVITSVLAGRWSDRVGQRKVFVAGASAVIACAALIMAFFQVWPAAMVGAAVLGIGFGAYLAVDFALLTQVLPSAAARGKDMGVVNVAAALPQVVAPALALLAVKFLGGYMALFVLAAIIGLAAAALVYRIKSVP
ncbi:MAG: MFS transporter [Arthrobacter sp.]|uniref:MFS transporter n=1 Tax=unclassified Arthrobacter TaxID=235627 RepID=UPI0026552409|nr:MFS transporter [Micrococcaceae bacterium]MDN5812393.1 MFS transporter [Micrococcaceae bacterium]MDN5823374.1 MFS transporter [Micrococcaceae bacterium]MDN5878383.1 MFS transporter [Micrococcaceae bacterium]MDN5885902.1 MFS transporter [Micrococcaceae bacterium]